MKWGWPRTAEEMARDFAKGREPQSDDQFVAECNLPDDAAARQCALAVRRSVARYSLIDPQFIRATDRYPNELINLSGWDSLDFVEWVMGLEEKMHVREPIDEAVFSA